MILTSAFYLIGAIAESQPIIIHPFPSMNMFIKLVFLQEDHKSRNEENKWKKWKSVHNVDLKLGWPIPDLWIF